MELPSNLFVQGFAITGQAVDVDRLSACRRFICKNFSKSKTFNDKRESYWFRYVVANRINAEIQNGEFIASMILEGFAFKVIGSNAIFNVLESSVRVLFSESVLSLGYKAIKMLRKDFLLEFTGRKEFDTFLKDYNSFEMPIGLRLETLLLNRDEAVRFVEFIRKNRKQLKS